MADPEPPAAAAPDRRRGVRAPLALAVVAVAALLAVAVAFSVAASRGGGDNGADPCGADPVDVGFATDMLDHHQQALQMALVAQDKATTTPVRALAVRMITAQQLESGRFLQYLEETGRHQGDPDREVMGWMGTPRPRAQMPGLATPEELLALTNATGAEVDRQFLDLMIRHHDGGVHMAGYMADHGCDQPLRQVAGRMVVMQRREIADMDQLRSGLG
jgi:uncharacterized protein (DUF305 family)